VTNQGYYRLILAMVAIFLIVSINYILAMLPLSVPARAILVAVLDISFCTSAVLGFREGRKKRE